MNYEETKAIVEQSLKDLGVNPADAAGPNKGQWSITYKGSTVWIDVFNFETQPERYYVQVMSPLLAAPTKNQASFYQNVLEINSLLYGCAICKKDAWLYVINIRESVGLDKSEFDATLDRVAFYSSDYKGKLSFKYEGSWDAVPSSGDGGKAPGSA